MDNIPIPKTRAGILSSLILSSVLLSFYYLFAFSHLLLPAYNEQFYTPILYEEKCPNSRGDKKCQNENDCSPIETYVRMPIFVYGNGRQWVYVSFYNDSDKEVRDIHARFILLEAADDKSHDGSSANPSDAGVATENNESNMLFLLPSFFSDNVTDNPVDIDAIQPRTKIYGRFDFPTRTSVSVNNTKLIISCAKDDIKSNKGYSEKNPKSTIPSEESNIRAFLHTTLENLLLPPWANAIVPAFAILSSWLFEHESCKDKKDGDEDKEKDGKADESIWENKEEKKYQRTSKFQEILFEIFRIVFWGGVFNLILWAVFILSVQKVFLFVSILSLLVTIPIAYMLYDKRKMLTNFFVKQNKLIAKFFSKARKARKKNSDGKKPDKVKKKKGAQILENSKDKNEPLSALVETKFIEKEENALTVTSVEKSNYWCRQCGTFYGEARPEKCEKCGSDAFQDYPPVNS